MFHDDSILNLEEKRQKRALIESAKASLHIYLQRLDATRDLEVVDNIEESIRGCLDLIDKCEADLLALGLEVH